MQCLKSTLCLLAGVSWSCLMYLQSFYIRSFRFSISISAWLHTVGGMVADVGGFCNLDELTF